MGCMGMLLCVGLIGFRLVSSDNVTMCTRAFKGGIKHCGQTVQCSTGSEVNVSRVESDDSPCDWRLNCDTCCHGDFKYNHKLTLLMHELCHGDRTCGSDVLLRLEYYLTARIWFTCVDKAQPSTSSVDSETSSSKLSSIIAVLTAATGLLAYTIFLMIIRLRRISKNEDSKQDTVGQRIARASKRRLTRVFHLFSPPVSAGESSDGESLAAEWSQNPANMSSPPVPPPKNCVTLTVPDHMLRSDYEALGIQGKYPEHKYATMNE